jgi:hypothetical protein
MLSIHKIQTKFISQYNSMSSSFFLSWDWDWRVSGYDASQIFLEKTSSAFNMLKKSHHSLIPTQYCIIIYGRLHHVWNKLSCYSSYRISLYSVFFSFPFFPSISIFCSGDCVCYIIIKLYVAKNYANNIHNRKNLQIALNIFARFIQFVGNLVFNFELFLLEFFKLWSFN